jgi:hypothetical protein
LRSTRKVSRFSSLAGSAVRSKRVASVSMNRNGRVGSTSPATGGKSQQSFVRRCLAMTLWMNGPPYARHAR